MFFPARLVLPLKRKGIDKSDENRNHSGEHTGSPLHGHSDIHSNISCEFSVHMHEYLKIMFYIASFMIYNTTIIL